MLSKQDVSVLVQESLKGLNEEKEDNKKIPVSEDTVLLGTGTLLDSLDFIVIITDIEERIFAATGQDYQLSMDLDSPEESNPFRNIGTLSEHIAAELKSGTSQG